MNQKHSKKQYLLILVSILFFLIPGFGWGIQALSSDDVSKTEEDSLLIQELDYHNIVYNNKKYVYNQKITTVLYAGVDSDTELITSNRYTVAPRADSIELVVLDNYHKVIKMLAVSRDTITAVERYTMNGNSRGKYDAQLGYAYAYGDGGKASCTNLTQAVSELLGGIPIQEYAVTNNASITTLNNLVGKVSVTVPTDDMSAVYPEFQKGAVVTLDDTNVEAFVRWRDISAPFSNNERMKRQEAFSKEFLQRFKREVGKDPEGVWNEIEAMRPYIQTSITKSQYLRLSDLLIDLTFSEADYYYLYGNVEQGSQYEEVYLDKENLAKTIIDVFYIEDGDVEG